MHKLTDVDYDAKTAICSVCGPTTIKVGKQGAGRTRKCMTVINAQEARRDVKPRAWIPRPDGPCAICGRVGKLHQDHNHATGKNRDLLCLHCNVALGHLFEDEARFLAAIDYLRRWA